jgi:hypothetical protein
MIVLLLLALGTALIAICAYAYWAKQREDTPEALRGDWWSHFEAEFREYARRCDAAPGARRCDAAPGARRPSSEGRLRQQRSPRGRDRSF